MKNTIYTLPQDSFVAGQTRKYAWRLYRESGDSYTANGCTGTFSLIDYSDKDSDPIFTKDLEFASEQDDPSNIARLTLDPEDTLYLDGKYIYQISIRDTVGNVDIPNKGIFYISNNIHKSFVE